MRIALFGGSFDPPHRGHAIVACAAANAFALDRILLAPSGRQPLKPEGASASFEQRLAMTELLCREDARLEASDLDAPREDGQPNYTIDTLTQLRRELPGDAALFHIVGADSFLDLRRWREPDALLAAAEWIVVSRPGFSLAQLGALGLTAAQRARVHVLDGIDVPISASAIRECLRTRGDCAPLLTAPVFNYVREHQLYAV